MSKCPIHPQEELIERWKKDDPNHTQPSFFSHKDGSGWCNGKPPRPNSNAVQSQALDVILNKIIKIETRLDKMAEFLKLQNWPGGVVEKVEKIVHKDIPF